MAGDDDGRTMMTRFARVTATAALAATLAAAMQGCGSDVTPTTGTPTPSFLAWSPTPEVYRTLTQQELAAALLDLGYAPANYVETPPASNWLDRKFCAGNPPHAPAVQASVAYAKDRGRPGDIVRSSISLYATAEAAAASFDALAKAVEGCREETAGGRDYRYGVPQLPAALERRPVAVRLTAGETSTLQGWLKAGPAVITVEMGELTPDNQSRNGMNGAVHDASRLVELLETQLSRYKNAAGCGTCR
jgi:hypothetical protein